MTRNGWRSSMAAVALVATVVVPTPLLHAQPVQTVDNTAVPTVIRVAIREGNNPRGRILWVQTVGFREYCEYVLPNEWMPGWDQEALRAGAIAVKMFGWYHSLHPITQDGWTYDVDNTTNFQEYKYQSGTYQTDQAVRDTWNMAYTPSNSEIRALDYRAGYPNSSNSWYIGTNRMSQWGSEYWASVGRLPYLQILALYYPSHKVRWL